MSSQPAATSANAGSGQAANGETVDSLRQRLHEAEHVITGLKAEQKATQDFFLAQNAELKKENNQLREDNTVFRSQNSQAGNNGNEVTPGASVAMSPEDRKKLQGILQEVKLHGSELHKKLGELHDCVLSKQEEFSRKRRRKDSDIDINEGESLAMQFVKVCKRYRNQTNRCIIGFQGAINPFIEDLSRAQESQSSLTHEKIHQNLADFVYSENKPGWHCLREVCEKGKLSNKIKIFSTCPLHGSYCEFLISKDFFTGGQISFAPFGDLQNSAK